MLSTQVASANRPPLASARIRSTTPRRLNRATHGVVRAQKEEGESLGDKAKHLAQGAQEAIGAAAQRMKEVAAGAKESILGAVGEAAPEAEISSEKPAETAAEGSTSPAEQARRGGPELFPVEHDPAKDTVEGARGFGKEAWASSKQLAREIAGDEYQSEEEGGKL